MSAEGRPAPPESLGEAGRGLWVAIIGDLEKGWMIDTRELAALTEACKLADHIAELDAAVDADGATVKGSRGQTVIHPAISEARQLRLAQLRLLGVVEMVDPTTALKAATPAQRRARSAAQTRWRERKALREAG